MGKGNKKELIEDKIREAVDLCCWRYVESPMEGITWDSISAKITIMLHDKFWERLMELTNEERHKYKTMLL